MPQNDHLGLYCGVERPGVEKRLFFVTCLQPLYKLLQGHGDAICCWLLMRWVFASLHQLYVGDGDSTVKVVDLDAKAVVAVIPTGGQCRADELGRRRGTLTCDLLEEQSGRHNPIAIGSPPIM
jgi:hypothetical protein